MKTPRVQPFRYRARVCVAAISVLALAVAGCAGSGGSPADEADDAAADASGKIPEDTEGTVRVLMEEVPDADIVETFVGQFNETYPDIDVQIEKMAYDQMRDKLVASFRAPEPAYDLVIIDNPWMQDFANAGFLQPLDSRIESTPDYQADDFFDPLTEITKSDDQTYAVPFYNYALGLIYRSDLYDASDNDVPTDLDGLVDAAKALNTDGTAGMAMQPQRGYKIFEEWGNYLFAAGGSIYDDDGNPTLDTPEAEEALTKYVEIYNEAAPANSLNWGFDEANRAMATGNAAQMVGYNWNLPALNDQSGASGQLAGDFELAPMPGGKQVLGSWSWAIPANSGAADAAWAFTSFITSPEIDAERVKAGGAAIRQSSIESPEVQKAGFGKAYYDTVGEILSDSEPLCTGLNCDEMIQAVGTELNAAVAGKKSVEDALSSANDAAERIQQD